MTGSAALTTFLALSLASMPEGVEHPPPRSQPPPGRPLSLASMPEGVEHALLVGGNTYLSTLSLASMPEGVEHLERYNPVDVELATVPRLDAGRR